MKINKFTAALVGLGMISLAGAAHASTITVYLTGSTACRGLIYNAALEANGLFGVGSAAGTVKASQQGTGSNTTSGAQYIVYEGVIGANTVDIDCSYTGSEAGIAETAGNTVLNTLSDFSTTAPLPGVPAQYLSVASGYTSLALIPGGAKPDFTMADTSQHVSLTPDSGSTQLHYFGTIGCVTFTFMKGYDSAPTSPDSSWNHLTDITTTGINTAILGEIGISFLTGNPSSTDGAQVAIVGRNEGSGTRVTTLLNAEQTVGAAVDQWAVNWSYPASATNVMTFGGQNGALGDYASGQTAVESGPDGFDGGSTVAQDLQVDEKNMTDGSSPLILVGYLGVSDAKNAATSGKFGPAGQVATYLPFNGVYEGDAAVINGSYTYWGQEHLYGQNSPTSQDTTIGNAMAAGLVNALGLTGGSVTGTAAAGTATGNVLSNPSQSICIPISLMQASRNIDGGLVGDARFGTLIQ